MASLDTTKALEPMAVGAGKLMVDDLHMIDYVKLILVVVEVV